MARTHKILTSPLTAGTALDEEQKLEQEMLEGGVRRFWKHHQDAIDRGHGASIGAASDLVKQWYEPVVEGMKACRREVQDGLGGLHVAAWGPVVQLVSPEKLAAISLYTCVSRCTEQPHGMSMTSLAYDVGAAVVHQLAFDAIKREDREKPTEERIGWRIREACKHYSRKRWNHLLKSKWNNWQCDTRLNVALGAQMIHIVGLWCHTAREDGSPRPAFRTFKSGRTQMVRMSDDSLAMVHDANERRSKCRPRYMAMRIEPQPWQQVEVITEEGAVEKQTIQGGYVYIRTPLVSHVRREHKRLLKNADLRELYECHNAVGMTPQGVFGRVFGVQKDAWKQGGGVLGLPPSDNPPKPLPIENPTEEQLKAHKRRLTKWHDRCVGLKGEREAYAQALACAEWYATLPEVYFPHQMDFRGREYPLPAQLNFQGDDARRGLLRLARAVPVSDRGRWWIMVHAANCYGHDKLKFEDRVQWTLDNMTGIVKSAKHGLDEDFWQRAENPWQFLGACYALTSDEDAAHLPVQQDATCSGLQHYAALCLDERGGRAVNLVPGDEVQDVYSVVLDSVRPVVEADARAGNTEALEVLPHLVRKVIKQNVMTTVYGVTIYGMGEQVEGQLIERGMIPERAMPCAFYLARAVEKGIGDVMAGASRAMEWLRHVAEEVCSTVNSNGQRRPTKNALRWNTPLGFPVVQLYRNSRSEMMNTAVGSLKVRMEDERANIRVKKSRNAFPPNFIHGLDATHNLLNARECLRAGYAYIPVHDCVATHAEHVDDVGRVIRSQFVALYQPDLLADLANQVEAAYPGVKLRPPPSRGNLDLTGVLRSRYFYC